MYRTCTPHISTDFTHITHSLSWEEREQLDIYRKILTAIPGLEEQTRYTLKHDFSRLEDLALFVRICYHMPIDVDD